MDRHPQAEGLSLKLPVAGGGLETYRLLGPRPFARPAAPFTRIALAAAHVVADPLSPRDPWLEPAIDWDATLAYRRHLWSWGFGVAESMDTAQRGMGLDWTNSLELIRRTLDAAKDHEGAVVFSGAGTDHVAKADVAGVIAAYEAARSPPAPSRPTTTPRSTAASSGRCSSR
jgi:Protein of unknown function (DUF993)